MILKSDKIENVLQKNHSKCTVKLTQADYKKVVEKPAEN